MIQYEQIAPFAAALSNLIADLDAAKLSAHDNTVRLTAMCHLQSAFDTITEMNR